MAGAPKSDLSCRRKQWFAFFFSFFLPPFPFQNQIEKIENLGCFPNLRYRPLVPSGRSLSLGLPPSLSRDGDGTVPGSLALTLGAVGSPSPHPTALPLLCRFLSLSGNRISRVENLQPLRQLRLLDLSHNQIQMLDPGGRQEWAWMWPGSAQELEERRDMVGAGRDGRGCSALPQHPSASPLQMSCPAASVSST